MIMDEETKALIYLCILVSLWVGLPILPAWLTYRITPKQQVVVDGPFHGLTMDVTGSFAAYIVVALLLAYLMWPTVNTLEGKLLADNSIWTVEGQLKFYAVEGEEISEIPELKFARIYIRPDINNIFEKNLSIKVPILNNEKPTIFFDVPGWGGAEIPLNDNSHKVDKINKVIHVGEVQFRKVPSRIGIGETK